MTFEIADYAPHQADELVRLWRESFEHGVGVTDPHPLDEQRAYFESAVLPAHRVRVALRDGRLVGFMAANERSVGQLYVRVGETGQGIGAALIGLAQAQSAGSLWLFTFARNTRACRFYERHGFVAVARGFEPHWALEDIRYEWTRDASPTGRRAPSRTASPSGSSP